MASRKVTSPRMAKVASKVLKNPKAPKTSKALAGSALSQAAKRK